MTLSSFAIRAAVTALSASLLLSSTHAQQPFQPFARPAPAAGAPKAPGAAPTAPSPRAASCHNGASFDKFLAELKQQAVAQGVSQRALAEAGPYLVYDQGIVNRDRGQRVFGQIFTEFAGRMAANFRMQNGQQHIKTYAAAFARAEKEYGVPPAVIAAFWDWKAISAPM
jgi:membrane-bound lytic murein transglycosylase B